MAEKSTSKRGAGRRPKSASGERGRPFTTRLAPELWDQMQQEAEAAAKSMSEVMDQRLRKSFATYSVLQPKRTDHSDQTGDLIKLLARRVEESTGKRWTEDAYTFRAFLSAIDTFLSELAPAGVEVPPAAVKQTVSSLVLTDAHLLASMDDSTRSLIQKAEDAQRAEILKPVNWGSRQARELQAELLEGRVDLLNGDQTDLELYLMAKHHQEMDK